MSLCSILQMDNVEDMREVVNEISGCSLDETVMLDDGGACLKFVFESEVYNESGPKSQCLYRWCCAKRPKLQNSERSCKENLDNYYVHGDVFS